MAMTDNHGYGLAPLPVAPVHQTDMVLFPEGLKALKQVAKKVGLHLKGAYVNLDGGFDSKHNRKLIFNAGMVPKGLERHLSNPLFLLVGAPGFEPGTFGSQNRRATKLRYAP